MRARILWLTASMGILLTVALCYTRGVAVLDGASAAGLQGAMDEKLRWLRGQISGLQRQHVRSLAETAELNPRPDNNGTAASSLATVPATPAIKGLAARCAPLRLIVMCFNRPASLHRLLRSLERAKYGQDRPMVQIYIDHPKAGANTDTKAGWEKTVALARAWQFVHGTKEVVQQANSMGLAKQWLSSWHPRSNADAAVFLEDDIEVSPLFYRWLKEARRLYLGTPRLGALTLQRQSMINLKGSHGAIPYSSDQPYLYQQPGAWGFAPLGSVWRDFVTWYERVNADPDFHPFVAGLQSSDWFQKFEKSGRSGTMWSQWFIRFAHDQQLYTLYPNVLQAKNLAIHWREKGEHYSQQEADSYKHHPEPLVTSWAELGAWPQELQRYDWGMNLQVTAASSLPTPPLCSAQAMNEAARPAGAAGNSASRKSLPFNMTILATAQALYARLQDRPEKERFLFVMQGNFGFVDMIRNWLCNTKHMAGVHARLLLLMSDEAGYAAMTGNEYGVQVVNAKLELPGFEDNMDFGSYGYWKLTHYRVFLLGQLLRAGIAWLNIEPDAFWAKNPLGDNALLQADEDIISGRDDRGGLSFGFVLVQANTRAVAAYSKMERSVKEALAVHAHRPLHIKVSGNLSEQAVLLELIEEKFAGVTYRPLDVCDYVSGQWYDGGLEGDGLDKRQTCKQRCGMPFVINNNWIIGNEPKVHRAKRWRHWLLDEQGRCDEETYQRNMPLALETVVSLRPAVKVELGECPECEKRGEWPQSAP